MMDRETLWAMAWVALISVDLGILWSQWGQPVVPRTYGPPQLIAKVLVVFMLWGSGVFG